MEKLKITQEFLLLGYLGFLAAIIIFIIVLATILAASSKNLIVTISSLLIGVWLAIVYTYFLFRAILRKKR